MSNQIKFTQGVQRVTALAPGSTQSKIPATVSSIVTAGSQQPTFVLTGPLPQVRTSTGRGGISVSTGTQSGLQGQQKSFLIAASSGGVIPIQSTQTVIHALNTGQGGNSLISGLQVLDASPMQLPIVVSSAGGQPQIVVSSAMQSQALASRHGAKISVSFTKSFLINWK